MHHQTKNLVFGESVAQQVEHNTFNVGVPGSSPGGFTTHSSLVRLLFLFSGGGNIMLHGLICDELNSNGRCYMMQASQLLPLLFIAPQQPHNIITLAQYVGTTHLLRVAGIRVCLLLDCVCAMRHPRYCIAVRAPADSPLNQAVTIIVTAFFFSPPPVFVTFV